MSIIWLEISEIEYQFKAETDDSVEKECIQVRFKDDHSDPRPNWWDVWHPTDKDGDTNLGEAYHRYLKWREKGQILLGRIGVRKTSGKEERYKLEVIGIRTKNAQKSDD